MLNAGVWSMKLCSLTNCCAVMLKIVSRVVVILGLSLFALVQMISCCHISFCSSLEQYVTVADCTGWQTCMLFMFRKFSEGSTRKTKIKKHHISPYQDVLLLAHYRHQSWLELHASIHINMVRQNEEKRKITQIQTLKYYLEWKDIKRWLS